MLKLISDLHPHMHANPHTPLNNKQTKTHSALWYIQLRFHEVLLGTHFWVQTSILSVNTFLMTETPYDRESTVCRTENCRNTKKHLLSELERKMIFTRE